MSEDINLPQEALHEAPATEAVVEAPTHQDIVIGGDLTEDDLNRVYARLGRPETHEGYDLSEVIPENYNNGTVEEFKKKAFEAGMSNDAVKKMAQWYRDVEAEGLQKMERARMEQSDRGILQLKQEFGSNFDAEVNNARKALEAYTDNDFRKYMDETGLGNNPALVKAFAKIGRELSEDRLVQSDTAVRMKQNDDLRRSEIDRLRSSKEFMEKYRRGDQAAVHRLNRLYLDN